MALVVFVFLGKLRTTLIPLHRGAGLDHRHLRRDAGDRLQRQHRLAPGPGAGDRHRRRRRDRRDRERRAGDGGGAGALGQGGDPQGDGRDHRPIIAITLVLLSVFVPVAFIPGITGQLFRQFAVAVSVSMLISAINALSLAPALCSVLLKPGATGGRAGRGLDAGRHRPDARDGYAAVVRRLVRVSILSLVVLAGIVFAHRRHLQGHADGLPAAGGPGRLLRHRAMPQGASVEPDRHDGSADGGDHPARARRSRA